MQPGTSASSAHIPRQETGRRLCSDPSSTTRLSDPGTDFHQDTSQTLVQEGQLPCSRTALPNSTKAANLTVHGGLPPTGTAVSAFILAPQLWRESWQVLAPFPQAECAPSPSARRGTRSSGNASCLEPRTNSGASASGYADQCKSHFCFEHILSLLHQGYVLPGEFPRSPGNPPFNFLPFVPSFLLIT